MAGAYLDNAATTPVRPDVAAAIAEVLAGPAGNPSGSHRAARTNRRLLDDARDRVATAVGCDPAEVVFTSGGTEADDLAVAGTVAAAGGVPACSAVEHHAVLRTVESLGGVVVPVDGAGRIDLAALGEAIGGAAGGAVDGAGDLDGSARVGGGARVAQVDRSDGRLAHRRDVADGPLPGPRDGSGREPRITLVSVMLAGNEVPTVNDLAAVAGVLETCGQGVVLHTDAVAAAPWIDLAVAAAPASLVSLSGHKVGAPAGVGALVVREGTPLAARLRGGPQERERRAGTPNVAGAVGMGLAMEATVAERAAVAERVGALRDRLVAGLVRDVPGCRETVVGAVGLRSPAIAHVTIDGVASEPLLFLLDEAGIAASAGSSCASGAIEPSHVLGALGIDDSRAVGALRLSLGRTSTDADVDAALAAVPTAVARLRGRT